MKELFYRILKFGERNVGDKKKDKSERISYILTKETMGMTLMLFSAIVFIMLLSHTAIFAGIGGAICTFMYGVFGYGSILVVALLAYLGEWLVFGKKLKIGFKKTITIILTSVMLFLLFHAVSTSGYPVNGYGEYVADCYKNAQYGYSGYTFGGVVSSIVVYPILAMGGYITAYVIFSLLAVLCCALTVLAFRGTVSVKLRKVKIKDSEVEESYAENITDATPVNIEYKPESVVQPQPNTVERQTRENAKDGKFSQKNLGRRILFEKGEFAAESYRRNMIFNENSYFNHPVTSEADYLSSFTTSKPEKPKSTKSNSYTQSYQYNVYNQSPSMPTNYVVEEKPAHEKYYGNSVNGSYQEQSYNAQQEQSYYGNYNEQADTYSVLNEEVETKSEEPYTPSENERSAVGFTESNQVQSAREELHTEESKSAAPAAEEKNDTDVYNILGNDSVREDRGGRRASQRSERSNAGLFDDDSADDIFAVRTDRSSRADSDSARSADRAVPPVSATPDRVSRRVEGAKRVDIANEQPQQQAEEKPKHVWKKYVRPSLDLLDNYPENSNVNTGEIEDNKRTIVQALERYKISSEVANVTIGPAITRYDVIIHDKTNIKRSLGYRDAIAMELMKENVTAYLNYSKGALSIEVPNNKRSIVGLKTMLASSKFLNSKQNSLTFALGKNVDGDVVCPDITKMPHLLVAGTTGSGKSICLSALLVSLLYKYGPEELRLILVDPKQVEFISYDKLPHLMINEIIYDVDKAIKALNWAIKEMERRYTLFKDMTENGVATKNLDEYNAHLPEGEEKLPKIVIILDEFGDLMLQAKKDIESRIIKLVQKARACGIHLILATQRPSVDCITGLIKSNLPTRIGFKVNSFDDARTIFDIGGAEKLLGKGDAYFRSAVDPDLARIQCCFVDTHEVQKVTDFVKANNETYFDQSVSDFINTVEQEETANSMVSGGGEGEDSETKIDDTFIKALKYCVTSNQASVSMIQRRFPVGYIKACKIIDWMENMNYVTPSEGSKPRKVLLSKDEFFNIYGDVDD
ncbi:MAG: hypothetical protein K2K38_02235 [Clostridia bacterium]|nr:hypothetical protein [Clostridia bacterium]